MSNFTDHDLAASAAIQTFEVVLAGGTREIGSSQVVITYRTFGPTSSTNTLVAYMYSMDSGASYQTMTPSSAGELISIPSTADGSISTFEWEALGDVGSELFNKDIIIKMQVSDGIHTTPEAISSVHVSKTLRTPPESGSIKSNTYSGVHGNDLLASIFG